MPLQLAADFTLPEELVTETIGIVARKRRGKSYTGRKIVEQVFHAGDQVGIVDPKGDWWGIRTAADGKGAGLPIVILGGEHGDLPLDVGNGEEIAEFVVHERISFLLDLSQFRKHQVATFMATFLETLYRLKSQEQYRTPMLLVIDEADAIAPQKPQPGEQRMLGAAEDIVRRGGQRGLGCLMISQRAAVVNKNVLTQIGVLVLLQTTGPQDLAAIDDWVQIHGTQDQRAQLRASIGSLPIGTAWVVAPAWPSDEGIFRQVAIGRIETYDSGATPKRGQHRQDVRTVADVDLGALSARLAATIERAQEQDPKALQVKLAAATRRIDELTKARPATEVREVRVEVPVIKDSDLEFLEAIAKSLESQGNKLLSVAEGVRDDIRQLRERVLGQLPSETPQLDLDQLPHLKLPPEGAKSSKPDSASTSIPQKGPRRARQVQRGEPSDVAGALLQALARRHPLKLSRRQLSMLVSQVADDRTVGIHLGVLTKRGLVEAAGDV